MEQTEGKKEMRNIQYVERHREMEGQRQKGTDREVDKRERQWGRDRGDTWEERRRERDRGEQTWGKQQRGKA